MARSILSGSLGSVSKFKAQTTDDTVTTIYTGPEIPENTSVMLDVACVAKTNSGNDTRVDEVIALYHRGSGGLALVDTSSLTHLGTPGSDSWDGVGFGVSGNKILITVQGAVDQVIDWAALVGRLKNISSLVG